MLVSIHHNANMGKWGSHGGVETFVQHDGSQASHNIAATVHPLIVKAMGLSDRGCKTSNFHMTRESRMPAILTEGGFMDSLTDISALRSDAKLKAQGEAIADELADYFKLIPKIVQNPKPREEGIRMIKPSSATLKTSFEQYLSGAVKDGTIAEKWLTDFKAGKLSLDDALALKVIVDQRRK